MKNGTARSNFCARNTPANCAWEPSEFNERNENIFSAKADFSPRNTVQFFFKGYYHRWDSHYTE